MKESFAKMTIDARDRFREALIKRNGEMKVILCGGGANYKWYKSCISSTREQIRNTLGDIPSGLRLKFEDVYELGRYYNSIDHRLIISSCLAKEIQSIPDLDGFPWDYDTEEFKERDDDRDDILNEKYPK